jgi:hypothetical protein
MVASSRSGVFAIFELLCYQLDNRTSTTDSAMHVMHALHVCFRIIFVHDLNLISASNGCSTLLKQSVVEQYKEGTCKCSLCTHSY